MSFTETLFGGLIAVIVLYMIARRAGLPNFWSALLSGGAPFLAYLAYCLSHGFSGDVLTIHLVVYLAAAAVMGVFSNAQKARGKMHWVPKVLMSFFGTLVVLMAIFLSISLHGLPTWASEWLMPNTDHHEIHTDFSGVTPNSHSAE